MLLNRRLWLFVLTLVSALVIFQDVHARGGPSCYTYECRQNAKIWSYVLYPALAIAALLGIRSSIKKSEVQKGFVDLFVQNVLPYIVKFAVIIGIASIGTITGEKWLTVLGCVIGFYLLWTWWFQEWRWAASPAHVLIVLNWSEDKFEICMISRCLK